MKIDINCKRLWLNLGWYPGDELALFKLELLNTVTYNGRLEMIAIFGIHILRFVFSFGWFRY